MKKESIQVHVTFPREIFDRINKISRESGLKFSNVVNLIMFFGLPKIENQNENQNENI